MLLACVTVLSLAACGGEKEAETTDSLKTDWRNTIEYEGSFYVNKSIKVLYALDKGTITIWDNAGNGNSLQTINYNTGVADAIERIEKKDFNNDGNCDIRIIYSESEKGNRYNLFLWSENTGRFAECRLYNEITDPIVEKETGYVIGVFDNGYLGVVTTRYSFNENCGLDVVDIEFSNPQGVVTTIATTFLSAEKLIVVPGKGNATIDDVVCTTYIVNDGSKDVAYVSYTEAARWYIDRGCHGFYREVLAEDGSLVLGKYEGEYNGCHSLATLIKGEDCMITEALSGIINGEAATKFTLLSESGESVLLVNDKRGYWYLSENGETYVQVNGSTGVKVNDDEHTFERPLTDPTEE